MLLAVTEDRATLRSDPSALRGLQVMRRCRGERHRLFITWKQKRKTLCSGRARLTEDSFSIQILLETFTISCSVASSYSTVYFTRRKRSFLPAEVFILMRRIHSYSEAFPATLKLFPNTNSFRVISFPAFFRKIGLRIAWYKFTMKLFYKCKNSHPLIKAFRQKEKDYGFVSKQ